LNLGKDRGAREKELMQEFLRTASYNGPMGGGGEEEEEAAEAKEVEEAAPATSGGGWFSGWFTSAPAVEEVKRLNKCVGGGA